MTEKQKFLNWLQEQDGTVELSCNSEDMSEAEYAELNRQIASE